MYLRHASLTKEADRPLLPYKIIALNVGVKLSLVKQIMHRWRLNNHNVNYLSKIKKGRKKKFDDDYER